MRGKEGRGNEVHGNHGDAERSHVSHHGTTGKAEERSQAAERTARMSNTTPQKEVAEVLSAEKRRPHKRQMIDGITATTWDEADAVIAHLWEQVDSYDFFDALETWVNSNDNYEPEDIARFTAEHLLGPRPTEQENDDA